MPFDQPDPQAIHIFEGNNVLFDGGIDNDDVGDFHHRFGKQQIFGTLVVFLGRADHIDVFVAGHFEDRIEIVGPDHTKRPADEGFDAFDIIG